MIGRPFWISLIDAAWRKRPIVWLSGVRRVGKTTLAHMFKDAVYCNCDLPSTVRRLEDPEAFFDSLATGTLVVFDEVHRLVDPSRLLKIGADAYSHLKILATGSSTLAATGKFRDTLTGRKQMIYLAPVLWSECGPKFNIFDLDRRLLHGGLPEALLASQKEPAFFAEWLDSFYARDIQELFAIRNRVGFMKLLHLLLRQSGGLLDYTSLAKHSDLSRPTVKAHLEAMCVAHAFFLLPPFSGKGRREITQRPKCYGCDTGIVTFARGWNDLRAEDRGTLWEHLVLDCLRTVFGDRYLYYWRDKSGREIDFVHAASRDRIDAIECKINPDHFDPGHLKAFRALYPLGRNLVLSPVTKTAYQRGFGDVQVEFCPLESLAGW